MLFSEKFFNFWEKYHISGKFFGISGKILSYLGKNVVCQENFFDSQSGTLTEIILATNHIQGHQMIIDDQIVRSQPFFRIFFWIW